MKKHAAHTHHHAPDRSTEVGLAETLDLDALLAHEHLQEIFEWTADHHPAPGAVVDLGAGTGSGALGLARAFPAAHVTAVDQSAFMLERLAAAVEERRLADRVSTLQIDLDAAWPDLSGIDLVWAASSLHHMVDPPGVLNRIRSMLAQDGLLVVVEMDGWPRHLPDDLGFGIPGLEQRLHDAAARAGWNSHPDWAPVIREAGMVVTEQRAFTYATAANRELIVHSAQRSLARMRSGLEDALTADDLATIDQLVDPHGPQSLTTRTDLSVRGSRTVWAARPAQERTS